MSERINNLIELSPKGVIWAGAGPTARPARRSPAASSVGARGSPWSATAITGTTVGAATPPCAGKDAIQNMWVCLSSRIWESFYHPEFVSLFAILNMRVFLSSRFCRSFKANFPFADGHWFLSILNWIMFTWYEKLKCCIQQKLPMSN